MKVFQEQLFPYLWVAIETYVQGLKHKEIPKNDIKKNHIVIQTKMLNDVIEDVKNWGICDPPNIVSAKKIFTNTSVALPHPIQHKFLQMFKDKVVKNSTPMGICYFFCSMQVVATYVECGTSSWP